MKKLKAKKVKKKSPKRGIERFAIKLLIKLYRKLTDRFNDIDELETMNSSAIAEIQKTLNLMKYEFNFLSQKTKASLTEFETRHLDFLHKLLNKNNSGNED